MSDRINYLLVTLEADIREDDCAPIVNAIRQIRGVIDVSPNVAGPTDHMAEERAKAALRAKLEDLLS